MDGVGKPHTLAHSDHVRGLGHGRSPLMDDLLTSASGDGAGQESDGRGRAGQCQP